MNIDAIQAAWKKSRAKLKWVMTFGPVLKPIILDLIEQIEHEFPQAGIGFQKLHMLHERLRERIKRLEGIKDSIEPLWPFIKPIIDALVAKQVAKLKADGVFK